MILYRLNDWGIELHLFYIKEVSFEEFEVLKVTPSGFWIDRYGDRRWVNGMAKNAFAFDTREKALYNYQKRKECQIRILKERLNRAEENLEKANKIDLAIKLLTNKS